MHRPYYDIFLDTNYIVFPDGPFKAPYTIRIGQLHPELDALILPHESWAFITAWNPLPLVLGRDENNRRNADLKKEILKRGYGCHPGEGVTQDRSWREETFLVTGIKLEEARELALQFDQMAFIYGVKGKPAELIYTRED